MGIFKRIFNRVNGNGLKKKEYVEHGESKELSALASSEKVEENLQKIENVQKEQPRTVLFGGGQAVRTPPKKPANIQEAGVLAEKFLKGE